MTVTDSTQRPLIRRLRGLWLATAVSVALLVAAPLVFHFGFGFPLFSFGRWVTAGALTFALAVPGFWGVFHSAV